MSDRLGWKVVRPGLYSRDDVAIERLKPGLSWRWRLCVPGRRATLHRRFSDAIEELGRDNPDALLDAYPALILAEVFLRDALDGLDSWRRAEATKRAEAGRL